MKSFQPFAILSALLFCSAASSLAQQKTPPAPTPKPRVAPGTAPAPVAQPVAPEAKPDAAEPKAAEPEPKAAEPKRAPDGLEEMVRGHRDARWQRARSDLRAALGEAGFEDKALQDAILGFAQEQDAAREKLRAVAARCSEAVRDRGVADSEIARLLESYQAASAAAQAEREAALGKLDEKVHYKASPRLQMLLRLRGVLGSEAWLAGDTLGESTDSFDLRVLYPPTQ